MGAETLKKLRPEALMLAEAERAELAHALVASLWTPPVMWTPVMRGIRKYSAALARSKPGPQK